MPLTCNIDARGKFARLVWGLILIALAIALAIIWAWPAGGWIGWTVVGLMAAFGAFGVFEARAGWCVARAMGMKTPI
jgi:hypothetical protein